MVPGAPNFRGVPGFNVYGVSLPTVEGIKATLALVGAAPGTTDKHGKEVCHGAPWWSERPLQVDCSGLGH